MIAMLQPSLLLSRVCECERRRHADSSSSSVARARLRPSTTPARRAIQHSRSDRWGGGASLGWREDASEDRACSPACCRDGEIHFGLTNKQAGGAVERRMHRHLAADWPGYYPSDGVEDDDPPLRSSSSGGRG